MQPKNSSPCGGLGCAARDQTVAVRQFGPPTQFSSPKHYKSPQDTLLSHFHFLNYTPILHRLEDEWWAFGPPLWASGPIFNFKSPQDTLLSNFHFLHYTPISSGPSAH